MVDILLNALFLILLGSSFGFVYLRHRAEALSAKQLALCFAPACAAWLAIPLLAEDSFGFLRLLSWVVFVHIPILLVLTTSLRRRLDGVSAAGVAVAAAMVAIGFWSFLVEPTRLEVNEVSIESTKVDRPIDIAVLADFQTDEMGAYEQRVLNTLASLDVDLLLLTGDYLQVDPADRPALAKSFEEAWMSSGIDPPMGAFATQGDTDPPNWSELFRALEVTPLDGATAESPELQAAGLQLFGLSVAQSFDTSARELPPAIDGAPLRIVFGHGPDFALGLEGADLLVAGHTHGGQVRLPLIGPLITFSRVPRSWAAGATDLPGGGTLVVSRGTGHERGYAPRLRFLCPPELVVIRVRPSAP